MSSQSVQIEDIRSHIQPPSEPKREKQQQHILEQMNLDIIDLNEEQDEFLCLMDELEQAYGVSRREIVWLLERHSGELQRVVDHLEG